MLTENRRAPRRSLPKERVPEDEGESPKETEKEQTKEKEGEGSVLETKEHASGRPDVLCPKPMAGEVGLGMSNAGHGHLHKSNTGQLGKTCLERGHKRMRREELKRRNACNCVM